MLMPPFVYCCSKIRLLRYLSLFRSLCFIVCLIVKSGSTCGYGECFELQKLRYFVHTSNTFKFRTTFSACTCLTNHSPVPGANHYRLHSPERCISLSLRVYLKVSVYLPNCKCHGDTFPTTPRMQNANANAVIITVVYIL